MPGQRQEPQVVDLSSRHPRDKQHIKLSYVVHFYLNQEKVSAVMDLLRRYEKYSPELLDHMQFVAVDDGSPMEYEIPEFNLNIIWLRITEDIPWNQGGARNLGVLYAKSDKVLMTDLDFEFPEDTLIKMAGMKECGRHFYKIHTKDPSTGRVTRGHPNTFLMSRARFLRFFGCDEEFCGHYGYEDVRFVKVQKYHGSRQLYLNRNYTCFRRQDLDRSRDYHSLVRDLAFNKPIDDRKKKEVETYGPESGYSRIFLNFHWEIVRENFRETEFKPRKRRLWKHLWYWRWLIGYP
jgi:glycosyltransferase involved in cell wall biosynthesis